MAVERPIFWHQGLFLQPQHLQLTDLYHQSLVASLYQFIGPYVWGVINVKISEAALSNFVFEVTQGEFLFPDGSHVALPENAILESRSFEPAWPDKEEPFTVYLGLRKIDTKGGNVLEYSKPQELSELSSRYVAASEAEEIADLYQDGPSGQVKKLNFQLKVIFETEKEQSANFVLFPLAQLEMHADKIVLSQTFIPPSLNLQSSRPLWTVVKDIYDQIASRGRQLEEYKRERGIHTAEFGARDMVYLLALRTLNRYIPQIHNLLGTEQTHPWQIYGVFRQLIGELSTFSSSINVMGKISDDESLLGQYEHLNIFKCFHDVQFTVTRLLDEITAGPEYVISLIYDDTYYAAELPVAIFDGPNRFYLVVESEEDPKQTIDILQGIAKLASREALPLLIARALPGIGIEHLPVAPQELPRRANCLYFKIDHHSDPWSNVQQAKNLALYWDSAPEDLKVELMVVGRK